MRRELVTLLTSVGGLLILHLSLEALTHAGLELSSLRLHHLHLCLQ